MRSGSGGMGVMGGRVQHRCCDGPWDRTFVGLECSGLSYASDGYGPDLEIAGSSISLSALPFCQPLWREVCGWFWLLECLMEA